MDNLYTNVNTNNNINTIIKGLSIESYSAVIVYWLALLNPLPDNRILDWSKLNKLQTTF